jgi:uncharacterized protein YceK
MATVNLPRSLVLALLALASCSSVSAQTAPDSQGFVGVKAGVNYEQAEDALAGAAAAGGLFGGIRFGSGWAVEAELWVPSFIRDSKGDAMHRDILVTVSAVRMLSGRSAHPYLVAGLSLARAQNEFTTCLADRLAGPSSGSAVPTIVDCSEPDVRERRREHTNGSATYLVAGMGLDVPLGRRLCLVPEIRVHVAVSSVIVRPTMGLMVKF